MTLANYRMATTAQFVGREFGASDWVTVDQERINQFAACTGDQQWIHVDVERATRESPFGGPIAHGYLSLSLVAAMVMEVGVIPADAATGLNYGLDKVRFIAPVKAGARVRTRVSLISAEPQNGGRLLLKLQCTLEIEGEAKPALVAEVLCMLIGKRGGIVMRCGRENSLPFCVEEEHPWQTKTPRHRTRTSATRRSRIRSPPTRWSVCAAATSQFRAHAAWADGAQPDGGRPAVSVLPRRARSHRDRRLRARARRQRQAFCRSGLEGEPPTGRSFRPTWPGASRSTALWMTRRWKSVTRNARALSSR